MNSWLAALIIKRNMARLNQGDYRPTLRMDARDIRFRFPGDSSWATELEGKEALGHWLQRFVDTGIQMSVDEVLVKGFPWKMTVCVRGSNYLKNARGDVVYSNRYVLWGRMSWGLLRAYEAYEDTQASKALDDYLESHRAHSE